MFTKIKLNAQATGWVGFKISLVLMLRSMEDPAAIGPSVAVALLPALYGILIAYWICLPISTKVQLRLDELKKAS